MTRNFVFAALALTSGCMLDTDATAANVPTTLEGKSDSGWLADTSYEVDAMLRSVVAHEATGRWEELATSMELQHELVDHQLKFIKNGAESFGYHANQLFDDVDVLAVESTDGVVKIEYRAVIDMLGRLARDAEPPTLDEIVDREIQVTLPLDPVAAHRASDGRCARHSSASAYNYFYYWRPELEGCDIDKIEAEIEIVEVLSRPEVYPEYDRLMRDLGDGTTGFRAALVPAYGDHNPMGRFDAHRRMLEDDLGLTGMASDDGVLRFEWVEGDVKMVIDLYDPTAHSYTPNFREALSDYQLVFYNGHSSYGTKQLLTDAQAYDPDYQILMLHSCRSYPYYVQQAFRAKATSDDPEGFDAVDFVATGRSSYARDSPRTLRALLRGLMQGMRAVAEGRDAEASDWLSIVSTMNDQVPGILYGVAGVRTNRWSPGDDV